MSLSLLVTAQKVTEGANNPQLIQVLRVGVTVERFVAHEYIQPWLIYSYKNLKGRGITQDDEGDDDISEDSGQMLPTGYDSPAHPPGGDDDDPEPPAKQAKSTQESCKGEATGQAAGDASTAGPSALAESSCRHDVAASGDDPGHSAADWDGSGSMATKPSPSSPGRALQLVVHTKSSIYMEYKKVGDSDLKDASEPIQPVPGKVPECRIDETPTPGISGSMSSAGVEAATSTGSELVKAGPRTPLKGTLPHAEMASAIKPEEDIIVELVISTPKKGESTGATVKEGPCMENVKVEDESSVIDVPMTPPTGALHLLQESFQSPTASGRVLDFQVIDNQVVIQKANGPSSGEMSIPGMQQVSRAGQEDILVPSEQQEGEADIPTEIADLPPDLLSVDMPQELLLFMAEAQSLQRSSALPGTSTSSGGARIHLPRTTSGTGGVRMSIPDGTSEMHMSVPDSVNVTDSSYTWQEQASELTPEENLLHESNLQILDSSGNLVPLIYQDGQLYLPDSFSVDENGQLVEHSAPGVSAGPGLQPTVTAPLSHGIESQPAFSSAPSPYKKGVSLLSIPLTSPTGAQSAATVQVGKDMPEVPSSPRTEVLSAIQRATQQLQTAHQAELSTDLVHPSLSLKGNDGQKGVSLLTGHEGLFQDPHRSHPSSPRARYRLQLSPVSKQKPGSPEEKLIPAISESPLSTDHSALPTIKAAESSHSKSESPKARSTLLLASPTRPATCAQVSPTAKIGLLGEVSPSRDVPIDAAMKQTSDVGSSLPLPELSPATLSVQLMDTRGSVESHFTSPVQMTDAEKSQLSIASSSALSEIQSASILGSGGQGQQGQAEVMKAKSILKPPASLPKKKLFEDDTPSSMTSKKQDLTKPSPVSKKSHKPLARSDKTHLMHRPAPNVKSVRKATLTAGSVELSDEDTEPPDPGSSKKIPSGAAPPPSSAKPTPAVKAAGGRRRSRKQSVPEDEETTAKIQSLISSIREAAQASEAQAKQAANKTAGTSGEPKISGKGQKKQKNSGTAQRSPASGSKGMASRITLGPSRIGALQQSEGKAICPPSVTPTRAHTESSGTQRRKAEPKVTLKGNTPQASSVLRGLPSTIQQQIKDILAGNISNLPAGPIKIKLPAGYSMPVQNKPIKMSVISEDEARKMGLAVATPRPGLVTGTLDSQSDSFCASVSSSVGATTAAAQTSTTAGTSANMTTSAGTAANSSAMAVISSAETPSSVASDTHGRISYPVSSCPVTSTPKLQMSQVQDRPTSTSLSLATKPAPHPDDTSVRPRTVIEEDNSKIQEGTDSELRAEESRGSPHNLEPPTQSPIEHHSPETPLHPQHASPATPQHSPRRPVLQKSPSKAGYLTPKQSPLKSPVQSPGALFKSSDYESSSDDEIPQIDGNKDEKGTKGNKKSVTVPGDTAKGSVTVPGKTAKGSVTVPGEKAKSSVTAPGKIAKGSVRVTGKTAKGSVRVTGKTAKGSIRVTGKTAKGSKKNEKVAGKKAPTGDKKGTKSQLKKASTKKRSAAGPSGEGRNARKRKASVTLLCSPTRVKTAAAAARDKAEASRKEKTPIKQQEQGRQGPEERKDSPEPINVQPIASTPTEEDDDKWQTELPLVSEDPDKTADTSDPSHIDDNPSQETVPGMSTEPVVTIIQPMEEDKKNSCELQEDVSQCELVPQEGTTTSKPEIAGTGRPQRKRRPPQTRKEMGGMNTKGGPYQRVRLVSRPWRSFDGTVNRPTLRIMLETVMAYVMTNPGVMLEEILKKYNPILQPVAIRELLEMLEELGCLSHKILSRSHAPSLFSPRVTIASVKWDLGSETVVFFPTIDCVWKLGEFEAQIGLTKQNRSSAA